jgi:hypothetical protein
MTKNSNNSSVILFTNSNVINNKKVSSNVVRSNIINNLKQAEKLLSKENFKNLQSDLILNMKNNNTVIVNINNDNYKLMIYGGSTEKKSLSNEQEDYKNNRIANSQFISRDISSTSKSNDEMVNYNSSHNSKYLSDSSLGNPPKTYLSEDEIPKRDPSSANTSDSTSENLSDSTSEKTLNTYLSEDEISKRDPSLTNTSDFSSENSSDFSSENPSKTYLSEDEISKRDSSSENPSDSSSETPSKTDSSLKDTSDSKNPSSNSSVQENPSFFNTIKGYLGLKKGGNKLDNDSDNDSDNEQTFMFESDDDDDESFIDNAKLNNKKYLNNLNLTQLREIAKNNSIKVTKNGQYLNKSQMVKNIHNNFK